MFLFFYFQPELLKYCLPPDILEVRARRLDRLRRRLERQEAEEREEADRAGAPTTGQQQQGPAPDDEDLF